MKNHEAKRPLSLSVSLLRIRAVGAGCCSSDRPAIPCGQAHAGPSRRRVPRYAPQDSFEILIDAGWPAAEQLAYRIDEVHSLLLVICLLGFAHSELADRSHWSGLRAEGRLFPQAIALNRSVIGIFPQISDVWLAIRFPLEERNCCRQAASSSSSTSSIGSSSSISANPGSSSGSAGAVVGVVAGVGISKRLAGFCGAGFAGSAGLAEGAF